MYCHNCGFDMKNSNFCPKCGASAFEDKSLLMQEEESEPAPIQKATRAKNNQREGKAFDIAIAVMSALAVIAISVIIIVFVRKNSDSEEKESDLSNRGSVTTKESVSSTERSTESFTEEVTDETTHTESASLAESETENSKYTDEIYNDTLDEIRKIIRNHDSEALFPDDRMHSLDNCDITYTIYDTNQDGINELIVSEMYYSELTGATETQVIRLFTIVDGDVKEVDLSCHNRSPRLCTIYFLESGEAMLMFYSDFPSGNSRDCYFCTLNGKGEYEEEEAFIAKGTIEDSKLETHFYHIKNGKETELEDESQWESSLNERCNNVGSAVELEYKNISDDDTAPSQENSSAEGENARADLLGWLGKEYVTGSSYTMGFRLEETDNYDEYEMGIMAEGWFVNSGQKTTVLYKAVSFDKSNYVLTCESLNPFYSDIAIVFAERKLITGNAEKVLDISGEETFTGTYYDKDAIH